jgi:acetyl esterase/lipase
LGRKTLGSEPHFGVAEDWPPTFLLHSSKDSKVPLHESKYLAERLRALRIKNELIVVEGKYHGFDNAPDAEGEFERLFDQATAFLIQNLQILPLLRGFWGTKL